ncbi:MAG: mycofactocin biosynthesis peptidyl-dipeptidase MftE [Gordonia sp. (in: high G+C Gram-positive bacteria)]|uniref:mycofactocin biosynthesis peptidyl-dipeptidase MftE n=1 Tax=Gordonia sp. (in: high G+C Gram-positive bacteria) TaxID=84139 RepID=UPI0039E4EE93
MTDAQLGARSSADLTGSGALVLVPLGATEQHGPHLPLDTDTRIAVEVATRAAERIGALVAPAIGYGASGEHEDFAGTISIGHDALRTLLVEYGRSACGWARRVVFVNGHGGNVPTLVTAIPQLRDEGRDVAWFACAPADGDAHAGHTETSMLLSFAPDVVDLAAARPGRTEPIGELIGELRSGGVAAVAPNGVLGDPTTATAEHGATVMTELVEALVAAVAGWVPGEQGRVRR